MGQFLTCWISENMREESAELESPIGVWCPLLLDYMYCMFLKGSTRVQSLLSVHQ